MPAVSQAQRRYLNARFGHSWVKQHHFDNAGKLPARKGTVKKNCCKAPAMAKHSGGSGKRPRMPAPKVNKNSAGSYFKGAMKHLKG